MSQAMVASWSWRLGGERAATPIGDGQAGLGEEVAEEEVPGLRDLPGLEFVHAVVGGGGRVVIAAVAGDPEAVGAGGQVEDGLAELPGADAKGGLAGVILRDRPHGRRWRRQV